MKLVIQIPCYNEEKTLPQTIVDLPKNIEGIDEIEYLVIDDGSTDHTAQVAEELGVHHIIRLGTHRGLATAFKKGIESALERGADIVVNTDGDNQYRGEDISLLVSPILKGKADMVVGSRPIVDHPEFSPVKKTLQRLGSIILRQLSKTRVRDAGSGFRAFSRETCLRFFIHSQFSYCLETLIQAGNSSIRVTSADIRVNPKTRESRLFQNVFQYVWKSGTTMLSMFVLYRPGRFFLAIASPFILFSLILGVRFIYWIYLSNVVDPGRTYLPSLILMSVCMIIGVVLLALGIIGELLKAQRKISEENLYHMRMKRNFKEEQKKSIRPEGR